MSLEVIQPETIPTVCAMLRTKNAFSNYDENASPEPWQTGASHTAVFWCLRTMTTCGPDDSFAHPDECRAGRGCFEPPID